MESIEIVIRFTVLLMNFFIPEILFIILFEKSNNIFRLRFSSEYYAKTWHIGLVIFLILFIYAPIFEFIFNKTMESILFSLDVLSLILLTVSLSSFTLIFIINYILEQKVNNTTRNVGVFTITSFIGFLFSYFHLF